MPANNLMLMTARQRAAASTYLMARRQLFFAPMMATAAGTFQWAGNASLLGGGLVWSVAPYNDGDGLTADNLRITGGTIETKVLAHTFADSPIVDANIDVEVGSFDFYTANYSTNSLLSDETSSLAAQSGQLSLAADGKNPSASTYRMRLLGGELAKTNDDGNDWGTGPEDLPWYQDIPPWFYSSTTSTASSFWAGSTSYAFGGFCCLADNDGEYTEYRIFCPATANYQLVVLYGGGTGQANMEVSVDGGLTLDSHDTYSGSTTYNNVATLDLGELSAGWHTVRLTSDDSASPGVRKLLRVNWLQLQRTTVGTCPPGVNGPEQVLLLPMFSDSDTGAWGLAVQSTQCLYGFFFANSISSKTWNVNLKGGTYKARIMGLTWSDGGSVAIKIGGSTEATGSQSGSNTYNQILDLTGITIVDGKNQVSFELTTSLTYVRFNAILLERTGD